MDRIDAMALFVRVVETGSFTAAAKALGLSRALASKAVQDLESRLGARLLNRTTRRSSLTEAGSVYYRHAQRLLLDLADVEEEVGRLQSRPRGTLRLSLPMSFGLLHIVPALSDYLALYPEMAVDVVLEDRVVDLIEEGFDVAIRIGRLADSSLVARRLAPSGTVLCAAPAYLDRRGRPETVDALAGHDCLTYHYGARPDEWVFLGPDGEERVRVRGRLRANSGNALRQAALDGFGLAILPDFIAGPDLASGRLVPLLRGHRLPEIAVHAVYPPTRNLSAKVRSFVDFLVARFKPRPPWCTAEIVALGQDAPIAAPAAEIASR
jgi:DNA-binding transcriptional LysR family regulator